MLRARISLLLVLLISIAAAMAQTGNQRLILKDGTYQIVVRYQVVGDRVRYLSAEREQWEELPSSLVDWAATAKWAKEHGAGAQAVPPDSNAVSPASAEAAAIDKEAQQERAEEAARRPEVAPGLRLPDEDGVWALDTYQDQPELVGLSQNNGSVNPQTGHNVLRGALNPLGGLKQAVEISGAQSKVQLHVNDPVFYVSVSAPDGDLSDSSAFTVDTHGAGSAPGKDSYSSPNSQYAIVQVESNFRRQYRVVNKIRIGPGGNVSQSENAIPATAQMLPGKHWMKLTPRQPLTIGDYALMEILGPGEVNLSVWDFRIDPQTPENKNAILALRPSP